MREVPIEKNKLKRVAVEFESALGNGSEEGIHRVLAENNDIFFPEVFTISKYKLADTLVTDFVNVEPAGGRNDPRARVSFVEIERADFPLFGKSGDPSAKLTHAIRQVQNWKTWVTANRDYLCRQLEKYLSTKELQEGQKNTLSYGFSEKYTVVIGRRNRMSIEDRLLLAQMNDDLDGISIMTYDALLDRIVEASREHKGYGWRHFWLE